MLQPSEILKALRGHPLIRFLINSKGNPKILLITEPLWGIPYNLIAPFATLYMYVQGVTDVQIGLILSISMLVKFFFCISGGIVSDKLGRKTTTILADTVGWSLACFIWAISNDFRLFLAAVIINSSEMINMTAWHCLLIEDAPEQDMLGIYTWVHIGGLVAVFFAPISGILIHKFSLVPVVRALYLCFAVCMIIKCVITYRLTTETRQGTIRMAQTKPVPVRKMIYEYKRLVPQIFRNRATVQALAIIVIFNITNMINVNFFGLYVTIRLGIAERYLAVFPILNAAVMLFFMFAIRQGSRHIRLRIPMATGFAIFAACQIMLILTPAGGIPPVVAYILVGAVANALIMPRRDALLALSVDPQERARIMAMMNALMVAFSSPFGYFAGFLSSIDRRLPFVFTCSLFLLAAVIMTGVREDKPAADIA